MQRETTAMTNTIPSRLAFEAREDRLNQLYKKLGRNDLRRDLTPLELFRLKEYGSIHFESAEATRKR
jgi:hypothetical protein